MPSTRREALVAPFPKRRTLAPDMARRVFSVPVPGFDRVDIADSNLTDLVPTEFRADLVLLVANEAPVLGFVVEVQLAPKEDKLFTWPVYVASRPTPLPGSAVLHRGRGPWPRTALHSAITRALWSSKT